MNREKHLESPSDLRFEAPLYTVAEAARALDVPATTFATWAKGYIRHPPGRNMSRVLPCSQRTFRPSLGFLPFHLLDLQKEWCSQRSDVLEYQCSESAQPCGSFRSSSKFSTRLPRSDSLQTELNFSSILQKGRRILMSAWHWTWWSCEVVSVYSQK